MRRSRMRSRWSASMIRKCSASHGRFQSFPSATEQVNERRCVGPTAVSWVWKVVPGNPARSAAPERGLPLDIARGRAMTGPDPTQDQILLGLARQAELFHDPDGIAYADLTINGHRQ